MGKVFDHITDDIRTFVEKQHMFFVATAPLAAEGHINLSPKGMDSFRFLSDERVGYLDLTGSGNETSAHITENGRITFMFVAFEGSPNIVRLYGEGQTVLPTDAEWAGLAAHFPPHVGTRQIIVADIHRVSTSCGYSIPFMDYRSERETLTKYWEAKCDEVTDYQRQKNSTSIDGIPTPIGEALALGDT
jgi:hypothetical protein